jgi:hypothetical protein
MPALALQLRLEERHVAAIDAVRTVVNPISGLTSVLSRQKVLLSILDGWIAANAPPPPKAAAKTKRS